MDIKPIYLLFGGPSSERSISLNSARSIYDHLLALENISVNLIYIDPDLTCYAIEHFWLYCNTLEDFSFKLSQEKSRTIEQILLDAKEQNALLWPLLHGTFGEDGQLQQMLEQKKIPFIGSNASTCQKLFKKSKALEFLGQYSLAPGPFLYFEDTHSKEAIVHFLTHHSKALCKPDDGGSSLGIFIFDSIESFEKQWEIHKSFYKNGLIIEPFYTGIEFSVVILEIQGKPFALIPSSIHYDRSEFYDFRKKYLPTTQTTLHLPAHFSKTVIETIRKQAELIFKDSGAKDLLRIDGWVFDQERVSFSDINICSGMEQNSLLFLQAAFMQISHQSLCRHLLLHYIPEIKVFNKNKNNPKPPVFILAGGINAEKQVSLLSGTNVWLKLKAKDPKREIKLFFVSKENDIFPIEEDLALYHTCEEIEEKLAQLHQNPTTPSLLSTEEQNRLRALQDCSRTLFNPLSAEMFTQYAKEQKAFVFLALHGGEGENGIWQKRLSNAEILFNGSKEKSSRLCMNKKDTGEIINALKLPYLFSLEKILISTHSAEDPLVEEFFKEHEQVIIKPTDDGCSAGVCLLKNINHFKTYLKFLKNQYPIIPKGTFAHLTEDLILPSTEKMLLEPFIQTEKITKKNQRQEESGWIELTYGLYEKNNTYTIFCGSQTLSDHNILSLEEKFQNGTGTNITPCHLLDKKEQEHIKTLMEKAARALEIRNYARFDIFYHLSSKKIIFIEANTLPALTPSTVIFHQALIDNISPENFLSMLIENASLAEVKKEKIV